MNFPEIRVRIPQEEVEGKKQPFKTNEILESLLNSQIPKWVNYLMLILVGLTLVASIWVLLHSYGII